jgi:itaconate CoA-transferase
MSGGRMAYTAEYEQRLTSAERAVATIPHGATVVVAFGVAAPPALLAALAARARAGDLRDVRTYYMFPVQHTAESLLAPDVAPALLPRSFFESRFDRGLEAAGRPAGQPVVDYVPNYFSQIPRLLDDYIPVDVFLTTVSPLDRSGHFTLGTSNDYGSTAARRCKRLLVEVNEHMPRVFGDSLVHVSAVAGVVENHVPLVEVPAHAARPEDEPIGRAIAELIPDGATLQLGIGGIPESVARSLAAHRELGIHSELFNNAMVDLIEQGAVTGRRKPLHRDKHVFTNALGDRRLYDFIDDNPSVESYPVSHTNDPAVVAQHRNFVSINSILEVDLTGQCNAEFLGGHQYSGTGGQLDFVRGAFNAPGGKSFLAFYSTAESGQVSRVVPRLESGAVVTTPRMDTHYLATEYGLVNLKGRSVRERALSIIDLAHPKFRDELLRDAQKLGLI